ncbi:hypothetical protein C5167_015224 [Papaver somniferum]|uniref:Uncharacterized protein n=1 Tax=Papaver somniferum TaxID=3469 RepID=A0A4Y7J5E1_PAPSO|nr:hypothetical protein C5167_015224 [Papaver somniferum]
MTFTFFHILWVVFLFVLGFGNLYSATNLTHRMFHRPENLTIAFLCISIMYMNFHCFMLYRLVV